MITVTHRLLTLTHKMKSFIAILAFVAIAAADVSHLQNSEANAQIISQESLVEPEQSQWSFETSNGIAGRESGVLQNAGRAPFLPTTPAPQPIPDYIQRAIAYIAAHPPKPEVAGSRQY
ncbi:putative cuticle protein [Operophtera brumata]|uniref:Putative cuticle protein n=1 Tax=Operophtera brumata TaxID=104452 RepID=A0A0L7LGZ6_OPEBR|nr:putative cuticle protein [Operophtera brumata]